MKNKNDGLNEKQNKIGDLNEVNIFKTDFRAKVSHENNTTSAVHINDENRERDLCELAERFTNQEKTRKGAIEEIAFLLDSE